MNFSGEYLECCDDVDTESPTESPTEEPSEEPTEGTCETNRQCARENLTGNCCPTDDGKYLDCCVKTDLPREALCTRNEKCAEIPLSGYCCPTAGKLKAFHQSIVFLECIYTPLMLFVSLLCIPVDVFLDCCDAVSEAGFDGVVSKDYALAAIGFDESSASVIYISLLYGPMIGWILMAIAYSG